VTSAVIAVNLPSELIGLLNNPADQASSETRLSTTERWSGFGQQTATIGFFLYSIFAPHSIAAAEISLGIAGAGWLVRTIFRRSTGFRRTQFDLPILLFFLWTAASSFLSQEPRVSMAKIQSTCVIFLFYLTQAIVTRRTAVLLVAVMILSGAAGTLFSIYDLARGRGVLVQSLAPDSPLRQMHLGEGDAVWRIGGQRVYSVTDIDDRLRNAPPQTEVIVSVITHGEHLERRGLTVTKAIQRRPSPSGITGAGPTHRFRASGWTRHYETYAEILQILAQLAFGLAIANFGNHGFNLRAKLAFVATALLAVGIVLTAMRTVLVAFAIGISVISVRSLGRRAKMVALAALLVLLAIGAFAVYQTRAQNALWLEDPSSSLRVRVARVGLSRMMLHPLFGHGMDAMHVHWREWGFPGSDMLHLHSTPLQLAFDRGLPALIFWLWIMALFWLTASRGEKAGRDSSDTNRYGILLGATGAVAGFFASSLVNYNFGDGEVALVFWWLLGIVVVLSAPNEGQRSEVREQRSAQEV
jgi:O-antigen ligase/polysaccharide polymerase Wzy-like membrane protein